jgi:Sec-independent protein translocase protein TatA
VKQALFAACAVVAISVSGCEERRSELMIKLDKAVQDSQKRMDDAQRELDQANKAASNEAQACILSFPTLRI